MGLQDVHILLTERKAKGRPGRGLQGLKGHREEVGPWAFHAPGSGPGTVCELLPWLGADFLGEAETWVPEEVVMA